MRAGRIDVCGGLALVALLCCLSGCSTMSSSTSGVATVAAPPATEGQKAVVSENDQQRRAAIATAVEPGVASSMSLVPVQAPATEPFDVVTVLWGTDRKLAAVPVAQGERVSPVPGASAIETGAVAPWPKPTSERAKELTLGQARITIPKIARLPGTIARPKEFTILSVKLYAEHESPEKHFTIASLATLNRGEFETAANGMLAASERYKDQAFIFIHGFNTTFDDALFRTAQIAYDLEFDGAPFLYSWPSKGDEAGYLYDRDSADRAKRYFLEFLTLVCQKTKATRVHVIAHSLGNRPLLEALNSLSGAGGGQKLPQLDQIILAAPDIDQDVFAELARSFPRGKGTTLFASSNDRALYASRIAARGKPRAGDVSEGGPLVVPGVETIDASAASTRALLGMNHSDYAERSHVLTDISLLMKTGVHPPDKRFPVYRAATTADGATYWKYIAN